jgi:hypothetical protein
MGEMQQNNNYMITKSNISKQHLQIDLSCIPVQPLNIEWEWLIPLGSRTYHSSRRERITIILLCTLFFFLNEATWFMQRIYRILLGSQQGKELALQNSIQAI